MNSCRVLGFRKSPSGCSLVTPCVCLKPDFAMGVSNTIRAALGALRVMTSYKVFHTLLWDAVT
eukprot:2046518-Rhodomonas_salina.1